MPQKAFRISIIYRTGDLFSTTGRIDTLHCQHCNSIWFYQPAFKLEGATVRCVNCFLTVSLEDIFSCAFEPVPA
ncbi:hypothetical protein ES703_55842 [subsurface metagenome]